MIHTAFNNVSQAFRFYTNIFVFMQNPNYEDATTC